MASTAPMLANLAKLVRVSMVGLSQVKPNTPEGENLVSSVNVSVQPFLAALDAAASGNLPDPPVMTPEEARAVVLAERKARGGRPSHKELRALFASNAKSENASKS